MKFALICRLTHMVQPLPKDRLGPLWRGNGYCRTMAPRASLCETEAVCCGDFLE